MSTQASRNDSPSIAPGDYRTDFQKRLMETPTFRATEFRVSAGQESPWHFHTAISDLFYVIEGSLQLLLANPSESMDLQPGQSYQVACGRPHRFRAISAEGARYLLIQGVGKFDFVALETPPE